MTPRRICLALFALGVSAIVGAIFWSLYSYGVAGQVLIAQGVRPTNVIHCLYGNDGNCRLIPQAATAKGTIAYSPLLFWAGFALLLTSVVTNLAHNGRSEAERSWGARLQRLLVPVDQISTTVGHTFAWCILALTLAITYEVIAGSKLFHAPTSWAYDATWILYSTMFMMAGAYALCRNGHVRGDFLYRSWSQRTQARMDLVLYFLFFFPGIIAFIYSGYGFAAQSWVNHEHSAYSPAGPPIYHYKTLIPITGVFLLLQGVVEVVRCLICLRTGVWPKRLHDVEELEKVILEQHADAEAKP